VPHGSEKPPKPVSVPADSNQKARSTSVSSNPPLPKRGISRTYRLTRKKLIISQIILNTLEELKLDYPKLSKAHRKELLAIRKLLEK